MKKQLTLGISALILVIIISFASGISTSFCANSISCIANLSGETEPLSTKAVFMGKEINVPPQLLSTRIAANPVLGIVNSSNKHIYVDLTNQKLYAFNGNDLIFSFPVSSGKWHYTPTGNFYIWIKLTATRMTGGSGADYYDLPNVPWTMFFANDKDVPKTEGYAIHGAYWNPPLGHPYSHGCINLSVDNAKLLYDWTDPQTQGNSTYATRENQGTMVTIFGVTPKS